MGSSRCFRKCDQAVLVVMKVHPVLTPVVSVGHQGELTTVERVKGMGDPKSSVGTVQIGCN